MSAPVFIGVDAGGTRTRLLATDAEGRVVARGEGGAGNLRRCGARGLAAALRAARASAGLDGPAEAAFLGVAGAGTPEERETARALGEAVGLAPHGRVRADHDLRVAHAGAFGARPGVVVVAGTGSAAYGRDAGGRTCRSGVWDHAPDDPGSGYDLGRHALDLLVQAPAGSAERRRLAALCEEHLPADAWRRLSDGERLTRGEVAALAPPVLLAAERGDPAARAALVTGLRHLAVCVRYVREELPGAGDAVCVVGGMTRSGVWTAELAATLARILPDARLVAPERTPLEGAARLARGL